MVGFEIFADKILEFTKSIPNSKDYFSKNGHLKYNLIKNSKIEYTSEYLKEMLGGLDRWMIKKDHRFFDSNVKL